MEGVDLQGAHVVEAVRQLDEDDANVLRHGEEHLADALSPGGAVVGPGPAVGRGQRVQAGQLGHAVHQAGHVGPEALGKLLSRDVAVLDDVVEEGSGQGRGVLAEVGQEEGRLEGMLDVGVPGEPFLALVLGGGEVERVLQELCPPRREVAPRLYK